MFWPYHDALFEDGNWRAFDGDNLKRIADDLGLNTEQFNECVDSGRMNEVVRQDINFARQLGVRSTPTFALNGRAVQGVLPFQQFQTIIDEELAK